MLCVWRGTPDPAVCVEMNPTLLWGRDPNPSGRAERNPPRTLLDGCCPGPWPRGQRRLRPVLAAAGTTRPGLCLAGPWPRRQMHLGQWPARQRAPRGALWPCPMPTPFRKPPRPRPAPAGARLCPQVPGPWPRFLTISGGVTGESGRWRCARGSPLLSDPGSPESHRWRHPLPRREEDGMGAPGADAEAGGRGSMAPPPGGSVPSAPALPSLPTAPPW